MLVDTPYLKNVDSILLEDGWHQVSNSKLEFDAYSQLCWFTGQETSGSMLSCPFGSILAVRKS